MKIIGKPSFLYVADSKVCTAKQLAHIVNCGGRDQRTLLDKMLLLVKALELDEPFYFIVDAYYASQSIIRGLIAQGEPFGDQGKKERCGIFPC